MYSSALLPGSSGERQKEKGKRQNRDGDSQDPGLPPTEQTEANRKSAETKFYVSAPSAITSSFFIFTFHFQRAQARPNFAEDFGELSRAASLGRLPMILCAPVSGCLGSRNCTRFLNRRFTTSTCWNGAKPKVS